MRTLIQAGYVVGFNGKSHEILKDASSGDLPFLQAPNDPLSVLSILITLGAEALTFTIGNGERVSPEPRIRREQP